ncbi:hypothetical protein QCA50_018704 [Cerrena zonata]|uniref:Uncharacterized protein n=1 Tax=Cerrena zonata TaxID=2478898 RepID=A0AAW0FNV6_9APHY
MYLARLEEELLASAQRHKLGTVFKAGDRETLGDRILPRQPSGSNVGPIPPSADVVESDDSEDTDDHQQSPFLFDAHPLPTSGTLTSHEVAIFHSGSVPDREETASRSSTPPSSRFKFRNIAASSGGDQSPASFSLPHPLTPLSLQQVRPPSPLNDLIDRDSGDSSEDGQPSPFTFTPQHSDAESSGPASPVNLDIISFDNEVNPPTQSISADQDSGDDSDDSLPSPFHFSSQHSEDESDNIPQSPFRFPGNQSAEESDDTPPSPFRFTHNLGGESDNTPPSPFRFGHCSGEDSDDHLGEDSDDHLGKDSEEPPASPFSFSDKGADDDADSHPPSPFNLLGQHRGHEFDDPLEHSSNLDNQVADEDSSDRNPSPFLFATGNNIHGRRAASVGDVGFSFISGHPSSTLRASPEPENVLSDEDLRIHAIEIWHQRYKHMFPEKRYPSSHVNAPEPLLSKVSSRDIEQHQMSFHRYLEYLRQRDLSGVGRQDEEDNAHPESGRNVNSEDKGKGKLFDEEYILHDSTSADRRITPRPDSTLWSDYLQGVAGIHSLSMLHCFSVNPGALQEDFEIPYCTLKRRRSNSLLDLPRATSHSEAISNTIALSEDLEDRLSLLQDRTFEQFNYSVLARLDTYKDLRM